MDKLIARIEKAVNDYEWVDCTKEEAIAFMRPKLDILRCSAHPRDFIKGWLDARGGEEDYRIPEDDILGIFQEYIKKATGNGFCRVGINACR